MENDTEVRGNWLINTVDVPFFLNSALISFPKINLLRGKVWTPTLVIFS